LAVHDADTLHVVGLHHYPTTCKVSVEMIGWLLLPQLWFNSVMLSLWSAPEITNQALLVIMICSSAVSFLVRAFFEQQSLVKRAKWNCGLAIVLKLVQVNILGEYSHTPPFPSRSEWNLRAVLEESSEEVCTAIRTFLHETHTVQYYSTVCTHGREKRGSLPNA
jgi:hypothetical protein